MKNIKTYDSFVTSINEGGFVDKATRIITGTHVGYDTKEGAKYPLTALGQKNFDMIVKTWKSGDKDMAAEQLRGIIIKERDSQFKFGVAAIMAGIALGKFGIEHLQDLVKDPIPPPGSPNPPPGPPETPPPGPPKPPPTGPPKPPVNPTNTPNVPTDMGRFGSDNINSVEPNGPDDYFNLANNKPLTPSGDGLASRPEELARAWSSNPEDSAGNLVGKVGTRGPNDYLGKFIKDAVVKKPKPWE